MDYVILPLYSVKRGVNYGHVVPKSGLNWWNAKGHRKNANDRRLDEAYLAIPKSVRDSGIIPPRVTIQLELPDGRVISCSRTQAQGKALTSKDNTQLGRWLLRDLLQLAPGQLAQDQDLQRIGYSHVKITRLSPLRFKIEPTTQTYQSYLHLLTQNP